MIKKITMQNCATYAEEQVLDDCQKVNFIYGANGSGKTTISTFIQNLTNPQYKNCSISWEKNSPREVLVYNRTFKEANFHQNTGISGVFTLGAENIHIQEEVEETKKQLEQKESEIDSSLSYRKNEEKALEDETTKISNHIWNNTFQKYKNEYSEVFTGYKASKNALRGKIISEYKKKVGFTGNIEELKERAKLIFSEEKIQYSSVATTFLDNTLEEIYEIEENILWNFSIIGNEDSAVSNLINHFNCSDWVHEGLNYISDSNDVCPFCQKKTINELFRIEIRSFFSKEYEKKISELSDLIQQYTSDCGNLMDDLRSISSLGLNFDILKFDLSSFESTIDSMQAIINNNLSQMKDKHTTPSKTVEIQGLKDKVDVIIKLFDDLNANINEHNNKLARQKEEQEKFTEDFWAYLCDQENDIIKNFLKYQKEKQNRIESHTKYVEEAHSRAEILRKTIYNLEGSYRNTEFTVTEINRTLRAYGFVNFKLKSNDNNTYSIVREDNTLATDTLSEGEQTFISLLYFLQIAKGSLSTTDIDLPKIMILDDPISSLDSTILYIVSALIKDLCLQVRRGIGQIKQIFLLTHNVFFHKEVSFVDGRTRELAEVNYWIIKKSYDKTRITSYGRKNPISTSYELLWHEIRTIDSNTPIITLQNSMRRIIEYYYGMLGSKKDESIIDSFVSIEDKIVCKSLLCWLNDGSHTIPDDIFIDSYTESPIKYKEVFKQIFLNTGHEAHYDMMIADKTV